MTVSPPPASARARAVALRGLCGGAVHLPGDPGYDLARAPWNSQVESFPAAVAYPAFPDEVADVLRAASAAGLDGSPRRAPGTAPRPCRGGSGTPCCCGPPRSASCRSTPERRIARAGAGVLWGDLADAAGTVGLAGLHPSSPDVGVVGYSIGGGIGLVRPAARAAVHGDHRRGRRPRRRHLRARHPRSRRRALLGTARRRRPPRRRHGPGVPAVRHRQRRRGLPRLGLDPGRAGAARVGGLVRLRAARGDDVLPPARTRRRSRRSRASCGAGARSSSTGPCSARTSRQPSCSRRCARSAPSSTPSPGSRRRRWCGSHLEPEGPSPAYASSALLTGLPTPPSPPSSTRSARIRQQAHGG